MVNQERPTRLPSHSTVDEKELQNVDLDDDEARGQASRGQKVRRHVRKHLCLYLVAVIISLLLVILLPIVFLVVIPKEIQKRIDNAILPMLSGSLAPINATAVRLTMTTQLDGPSYATITLEPFTLDLYNEGSGDNISTTTFATVSVPSRTTLRGTTSLEIPSQEVRVLDEAELSRFLTNAFVAPGQATLVVRGDLVARVAATRYPVRLDKEVSFSGLRELEGTRVVEMGVSELSDREADGTNIRGNLEVINYSPFNLALGNVTYGIHVAGSQIGEAYMNDVELRPGNQTLSVRGDANSDVVNENVLKIVDTKLDDDSIPFTVTGISSTVGGERISYLDGILSRVSVSGHLPFCDANKMANPMELEFAAIAMLPLDLIAECSQVANIEG